MGSLKLKLKVALSNAGVLLVYKLTHPVYKNVNVTSEENTERIKICITKLKFRDISRYFIFLELKYVLLTYFRIRKIKLTNIKLFSFQHFILLDTCVRAPVLTTYFFCNEQTKSCNCIPHNLSSRH